MSKVRRNVDLIAKHGIGLLRFKRKSKVPKPKGPSCVETLTSDLDMAARDKDGINVEIDVSLPYKSQIIS